MTHPADIERIFREHQRQREMGKAQSIVLAAGFFLAAAWLFGKILEVW